MLSTLTVLRARPKFPAPVLRSTPYRHIFTSSRLNARYNRFSGETSHASWGNPRRDVAGKVVVGLGALGGLYYVAHLEQVPETGRWRFMDVSPRYEAKLAEAGRAEVLQQYGPLILPQDHRLSRHVRHIVAGILEASDLGRLRDHDHPRRISLGDFLDPYSDTNKVQATGEEDFGAVVVPKREWSVMVVNSKEVNAFALPGTVVVHTGILPVCRDEAGLAAVLSHEIAHVVARHVPEKYSSGKVLLFFTSVLALLGLDWGISRVVSNYLYSLPNSRSMELEADSIGVRLMAKACYDPKAAPEMFTRLAELEKASGAPPQFMSTHPATKNRVTHLEKVLPEAYAIRAASPSCAGVGEAYESFIGSGALGRHRPVIVFS